MEFIGRPVAKRFPGYGKRKFRGRVTSYADGSNSLFHIQYDDGDEEDVYREELLSIIIGPKPHRKRNLCASCLQESPGTEQQPQHSPRGDAQEMEEAEEPRTTIQTCANRKYLSRTDHPRTASLRNEVSGTLPKMLMTSGSPSRNCTSSAFADDVELSGLIGEVAIKATSQALNVVRHLGTQLDGADARGHQHLPLHAKAVTCGNLCFISVIYPEAPGVIAEKDNLQGKATEFQKQAGEVLAELERRLNSAHTNKNNLLSVTVLLQDVEDATREFCTVWNSWIHPMALPALSILESCPPHGVVVAIGQALAAVPSQPF